MKYASPKAFRQSIDQRALQFAGDDAEANQWYRRCIAFDRVVARIASVSPEDFFLKGGMVLQYRFGDVMRHTIDLDYGAPSEERMHHVMRTAMDLSLEDYFEMQILHEPKRLALPDDQAKVFNWTIDTRLDGRRFSIISIDVGVGEIGSNERLQHIQTKDLLAYAGIDPVVVPAIRLEYHIAEKLHAYCQARPGVTNTRTKDLVDLALLSRMNLALDPSKVRAAIDDVFLQRQLAKIPTALAEPPIEWHERYADFVRSLVPPTLDEAFREASRLVNPALALATTYALADSEVINTNVIQNGPQHAGFVLRAVSKEPASQQNTSLYEVVKRSDLAKIWNVSQSDGGVVLSDHFTRIETDNETIRAQSINPRTVSAAAELAKKRGWNVLAVDVDGVERPALITLLALTAAKHGITVEGASIDQGAMSASDSSPRLRRRRSR